MSPKSLSSEFLQYLADTACQNNEARQLPSLNEIGQELGISIARLREQLEVAKALGLIEIKPRTGMRRMPYSFFPAIWQSLAFSMELDPLMFSAYSDLRNHLEAAYWDQAVRLLTPEDQVVLRNLVLKAWEKLHGIPVQIPHDEHRELHLTIYSRLQNPFVFGILEAYWKAYETVGLNLYADYDYLEQVWNYHQQMVDAICSGNFESGYQALIGHVDLLAYNPERAAKSVPNPQER